jgi:hypothetical protein
MSAEKKPIAMIAAIALASAASAARAQAPQAPDPRAVQPERPTVATHAGTVAPGWLEVETGVEFDRFARGVRSVISPTVFKIGLADRAQLNLFVPVVRPSDDATRLGDVAAGLKWSFTDDAPVIGKVALLPTVKLPTGSTSTGAGTGTTDLTLFLISSQTVGPVAVDVNVGYTRRVGDDNLAPRDATSWTLSLGGPAVANVGWVMELYGYPATHGPAGQRSIVGLLMGPTLLARPSWSLDAGIIVPVSGPQPHAIYVGTVFNVGRLWARTP